MNLHRLLRPLAHRVAGMVNRAVVRLVDDSRRTQAIQLVVRADETRDRVEHFQPAGFKSVPLDGAEALVVAVSGNGDHRVAVVVHDKRHRPTDWAAGDVGLYHPTAKSLVWLRANGDVEVVAAGKLKIKAPKVEIEGDLMVDGNVRAKGTVADHLSTLDRMREIYGQHGHGNNGSAPPVPPMVG